MEEEDLILRRMSASTSPPTYNIVRYLSAVVSGRESALQGTNPFPKFGRSRGINIPLPPSTPPVPSPYTTLRRKEKSIS